VKHARANDLIKSRAQVTYMFDVELVDVEILQSILFLKLLRVMHASCAAIDAGHMSLWPSQRVLGCLRCPASCDQDGLIFLIDAARPKKVKVRLSPSVFLPLMTIFVQAVQWRRIGIPIVEITYLIRYADS